MEHLLEINDLAISFDTDLGEVKAVNGVSFYVDQGEIFGIVGESGSGKSVTTKAILKLGPENERISSGEILFEGKDILKLSEKELRDLRGNDIAMVFQDSLSALNPVYTVGKKMNELIRRHEKISKKEAKAKVLDLFDQVGIVDPERCYKSYPHELSGGMRQRIMIAMAISCDPKLLIADEPTTALDVTIQAQILHLLRDIQHEKKMSLIIITHDLGVIAQMCSRVAVMRHGKIVEMGGIREVFHHPQHPYTKELLAGMEEDAEIAANIESAPSETTSEGDHFVSKDFLDSSDQDVKNQNVEKEGKNKSEDNPVENPDNRQEG